MVFVLGFGTSWMLYLHRYSFALIKPFLKQELEVSNTELGMMDMVFSMTYAGLQFPTGLLGDMAGVHWLLGGLILLWSIALAGHAWAPTKGVLYVFRALFGAGQAGVFSLVGRLTRCWFPARVRTTVQGWVGVFAGRFGGLSANVLVLTVMIGIYGLSWRTALYILATVGMLHGIMFLVAFRDSPREHPQANEAEAELVEGEEGPAANEPLKFRELIRQMDGRSILNLACINVSSIFSSIADQIYSLWIPLFLFEQYSLKFKEMGIYSALPLLGGACGGMLGGFISDRLIRLTGDGRPDTGHRRAVLLRRRLPLLRDAVCRQAVRRHQPDLALGHRHRRRRQGDRHGLRLQQLRRQLRRDVLPGHLWLGLGQLRLADGLLDGVCVLRRVRGRMALGRLHGDVAGQRSRAVGRGVSRHIST